MWVGWYRDGPMSPWERVCEGGTPSECHRLLNELIRGRKYATRSDCGWLTGGAPPLEEKKQGEQHGTDRREQPGTR